MTYLTQLRALSAHFREDVRPPLRAFLPVGRSSEPIWPSSAAQLRRTGSDPHLNPVSIFNCGRDRPRCRRVHPTSDPRLPSHGRARTGFVPIGQSLVEPDPISCRTQAMIINLPLFPIQFQFSSSFACTGCAKTKMDIPPSRAGTHERSQHCIERVLSWCMHYLIASPFNHVARCWCYIGTWLVLCRRSAFLMP